MTPGTSKAELIICFVQNKFKRQFLFCSLDLAGPGAVHWRSGPPGISMARMCVECKCRPCWCSTLSLNTSHHIIKPPARRPDCVTMTSVSASCPLSAELCTHLVQYTSCPKKIMKFVKGHPQTIFSSTITF